MKFDFAIGNPPYQDNTLGENDTFAPPVYNKFMDAAYEVANKVELVHPARFLFNAGSTPKPWNEKMLKDEHFKVLNYESDSTKVFANTDIKGGIVITYRDEEKKYGAIDIFTPFETLNTILYKVKNTDSFHSFSQIVITRTASRLTTKLHEDFPNAINQLSKGHAYDMSSNIFERLPQIFFSEKPNDEFEYVKILGREDNARVYKYVRKDYVNTTKNMYKYKLFLSSAIGRGEFGEVLSEPIISEPKVASTETFLSVGVFECKDEAVCAMKYIKTKFARALLGILKSTQANTPDKWKYVPLQDFTLTSDIDWSVPISEIDKQLYKKYSLSEDEITFIETNVKEMK